MQWITAAAWRRCCLLSGALRAFPEVRNGVALKRKLSHASDVSVIKSVVCTNREKGLAFEEQVVTLMRSLNCELQATQQSRDGGIDHQGSWTLPDMEVDVVTQCKNESKPVGVQYVREFHGVLSFFPPTTVGLFASASGYSLYAQRFFLRMTHPAILCSIDTDSGRLTSFLLNDRAQTLLPKLTVGSLFMNQEHVLVLTYGDRILG
ncbi:Restriction endonuclease [Phytophthora infestans]|uniref:Restriction endonuclease n=1 Tax=Phytophthora infestans TaxID=4787 RepID=A0A833W846_PHYIN|nr:Restriction endonuclease [Phytophthora infestans]